MIEEVARVFGYIPGQQQEAQESDANKQPLDGSAASSEQVVSLKPSLKRARFFLETEEEKIDEKPKSEGKKSSVTWAPSLT
jgi:hypothetical protein